MHKFAIGQIVADTESYVIIRLDSDEASAPRSRVKNATETSTRIVRETEIEKKMQ